MFLTSAPATVEGAAGYQLVSYSGMMGRLGGHGICLPLGVDDGRAISLSDTEAAKGDCQQLCLTGCVDLYLYEGARAETRAVPDADYIADKAQAGALFPDRYLAWTAGFSRDR